jgi:hypothetical protein
VLRQVESQVFSPTDGVPDLAISATINDLVQTLTLLLGFEMGCQIQCLEG